MPNRCQEGCCSPKEIPAPLDICTAKGIPVLADRIYDCVNLEDKQKKYLKDIQFCITSPLDNYKQGDEICIKTIIVKYKCIGLIDEEIEVRIDNLENEVCFRASNESESCKCEFECNGNTVKKKLYNIYKGSKTLDVDKSFSDIDEIAAQCKFSDCKHESEPGCAVRKAIEDGIIDINRFESYKKIQKELKYRRASKQGCGL